MNLSTGNIWMKLGIAAVLAAALGIGAVAVLKSLSPQNGPIDSAYRYDTRPRRTIPAELLRYRQVATIRPGLKQPRGLAVAPDGSIYVAGDRALRKLRPNGDLAMETQLSGPATCVTVNSGRVYIGVTDHIEMILPDGQRTRWQPPAAKTDLTSLAVSGDRIFAADFGNKVVWCVDHRGAVIAKWPPPEAGQPQRRFIVPSAYFDVVVGDDGLVRVANPGKQCVEVYTQGGRKVLTWGKPGDELAGFSGCCNPAGLAMLSDRRIVTAEKGDLQTVKVCGPDMASGSGDACEPGKVECVVAGAESFTKHVTNAALDVAVDGQDRIYVLDGAAGEIRVYALATGGPASRKAAP